MKLGVALPYGIARAAPELARQAEEAGWDGVFLGDAIWTEDPMIALAAAAVAFAAAWLDLLLIHCGWQARRRLARE
jgi:hypothetical protein